MTIVADRGSRMRGTFLLADISGYTGFLQRVANAHSALIIEADEPPFAYALLSSLLDAMVAKVSPRFRLVKLEGDALFAVADDLDAIRGPSVIECLRACHAEFTALVANAGTDWTCTCDSCSGIVDLGLKFVLHSGTYFVQRIAGREELAGPDVIVVHRLLKNHARDHVGNRPYALFSDAAVATLEVPADGMSAFVETYEGIPDVPVHVLPL